MAGGATVAVRAVVAEDTTTTEACCRGGELQRLQGGGVTVGDSVVKTGNKLVNHSIVFGQVMKKYESHSIESGSERGKEL